MTNSLNSTQVLNKSSSNTPDLAKTPLQESPLRAAITAAYRMDETQCLENLIQNASFSAEANQHIQETARQLVVEVRKRRIGKGGLDAFLYEYDLSSEEGIALMCLAEALLRIPDKATVDRLIRDKITAADWHAHLGKSESMFVNAATWGLMLTGKILSPAPDASTGIKTAFKRMIERSGEPIIRKAVATAMKILGKQFVMGRTIEEATDRARDNESKGYRFSYDMLGEAARTAADAERYFASYQDAITAIGKVSSGKGVIEGPGVSVKLSALHPRYEYSQKQRVLDEVIPRLRSLALQAKAVNIGFTIDAEEADRLDLSLDIIEAVFSLPELAGWEGFGIAVQSYQKRAWYVLDWLADLARQHKRRIMVRLIKGAYWDTEIKMSQVQGLESYPVFTRKNSTDVSFLACAKKIWANIDAFYPQFATHNAHSVAAILEMANGRTDFEFQCLHGMGYTLYDQIVDGNNKVYSSLASAESSEKTALKLPCRVYAPVGGHEDLLAYLVRRLLENGANSSFVNRIVDDKIPIESIIIDPVTRIKHLDKKPHPFIPLPKDLYGDERRNSQGIDLSHREKQQQLLADIRVAQQTQWKAMPLTGDNSVASKNNAAESHAVTGPSDTSCVIGAVIHATADQTDLAIKLAAESAFNWDITPVEQRAAMLDRAADLFEKYDAELMSLLISEGGKTIPDAIAEVREAVDYCRYYAAMARRDFASLRLPGPTGEYNSLRLQGRGVIACISPWNFPLAIFIGQVTAALVAGNPVIAKPAKQTPLIATRAVQLLHEAGIPKNVLHLLPGSGAVIGARLLADQRIQGVVLTGSTETARTINQTLAARPGPIIPLIAETGGQNAMIVDSSALPEQVVMDVIQSAFTSAGQRCSALRVLFLQEEVAPKLLTMLQGAMAELRISEPGYLDTDIGPVIDEDAKRGLERHFALMQQQGRLLYQVAVPQNLRGSFFGPCAFEIDSIKILTQEVFGPILHIVRYKAKDLDQVLADINSTGFGLTFGVHSRIDDTVEYIKKRMRVGNMYVNRNMIGAVVGVQPFGGEGLSGTGPKAGGPHYLHRLSTERTLCVNTTAAGGNATLMSLSEE